MLTFSCWNSRPGVYRRSDHSSSNRLSPASLQTCPLQWLLLRAQGDCWKQMSTCPWVLYDCELICMLFSKFASSWSQESLAGFPGHTRFPRCCGHHYLSPFTRVGEQDRPPVRISISIKMESLPLTDMKSSVLWGKRGKELRDVIWRLHPLLWQEFILYNADLWHENTASVGVVMIHDCTHTWTPQSSDSWPVGHLGNETHHPSFQKATGLHP